MGIYIRRDSPFYWMLLERPGQKPLLESTKIPIHANSAALTKQQRRDAEDVYAARMGDLARARHELPLHDPLAINFNNYADWWTRHLLPTRRRQDRDVLIVEHLRRHFGALDLTAIDRAVTQEYITARLAAKKAPNTVNREVDVLKSILRSAVPKYLKASPLAGMKKLRVVLPQKRVLTPEEQTALLAELHNPADRAFYLVAVDTLIRLQNVIDLRWSEVKAHHLELLDSKTGPYKVPLSDRAEAALASLPKSGVYVFPHRRTAKNMRDVRGAIRRLLKRACERADIPYGRGIGVTFHTATRATGATRMLRAGFDPRTVQAVGNWKDFRSMQGYLHPNSAELHAAVNAIAPITPRLRGKRKTAKRGRKHKRVS